MRQTEEVQTAGRQSRSLRTKCADLMILRSKIITFVRAKPEQKAASPPPPTRSSLLTYRREAAQSVLVSDSRTDDKEQARHFTRGLMLIFSQ